MLAPGRIKMDLMDFIVNMFLYLNLKKLDQIEMHDLEKHNKLSLLSKLVIIVTNCYSLFNQFLRPWLSKIS